MSKIEICILGERHSVSENLTVMTAMESVGYKFVHGSGCRGGFCGACAVKVRIGNTPVKTCLACQTAVCDKMEILSLPTGMAEFKIYDIEKVIPNKDGIIEIFPEVKNCIGCGACNNVCPKGINVMEYISAVNSGDLKKASKISSGCVMCGECQKVCKVNILQPQVALLARRIEGKYLLTTPKELTERIDEIKKSRTDNMSACFEGRVENDELLKKYHPNYDKNKFSKLLVGKNKGEMLPSELVDILQSHSFLFGKDIDFKSAKYQTDVLVIGGGGAGAAAALEAKAAGCSVMLISKLRFGDSNTVMAQGGISAAVKRDDSVNSHFNDSFVGSEGASQEALLWVLVNDAPEGIKWLCEKGVSFDRKGDGFLAVKGGGASKERILCSKDYTGMAIMQSLKQETISSGVEILNYTAALEILLDENKNAAGAVVVDLETKELLVIKAKAVILATGGLGRLRCGGFETTNHYGATADGLVMAYRAGAKLVDCESLQYHPTGAVSPDSLKGALITEKARSLGAELVNAKGERFVNSLQKRDVVTAAIIKETADTGAVWLDTPLIDIKHGSGTIKKDLPSLYEMFYNVGIDISKTPIQVYPTLHYQNGGVLIDQNAMTTVNNLFAAGEVTGGIHGKNRLMGNSLSDVIVFGRIAGRNAAKAAKTAIIGNLSLSHIEKFEQEIERANIKTDLKAPVILPDYTKTKDIKEV